MPGVLLGDCGPKCGLNSIDNGFIQFDHVRIPMDQMLDRVLQVVKNSSGKGEIRTQIPNPNTRFAISLGALSTGRACISSSCMRILLQSLTIAIRYGAYRRQFGKSGQAESSILEYPLHQFRLVQHLACVFACNAASRKLISYWEEMRNSLFDPKNKRLGQVHALISSMKAICTWYSFKGVQECREACGGHGYNAISLLGNLRNEIDVNQTWQGDNNVLLQQTSKYITDQGQKLFKGKKLSSNDQKQMDFLSIQPVDDQKFELQIDTEGIIDPKNFNKLGNALVKAFQWRVNYLLQKSGMKIGGKIRGQKMDPFDAWNDTQVFYLRDMAIAFGQMFVVKHHLKDVQEFKFKDEDNKKIASYMFLINSIMWVLKDAALFRQNDFVSSDLIKDMKESVLQMIKQLKDHLVAIIDSVALPDELVDSPLGQSNGQVYKNYFSKVESLDDCYKQAEWIGRFKSKIAQYTPKL